VDSAGVCLPPPPLPMHVACAQDTACSKVREAYHGIPLLEAVGQRWLAHRLILEWTARVFCKVDPVLEVAFFRQMCGDSMTAELAKLPGAPAQLPSHRAVGLRLFQTSFFNGFRTEILDVIQCQVERDRRNEPVDRWGEGVG